MYRRRLLAAAGLTTAAVAGCLTSDGGDGDADDNENGDDNSETASSEEPLPEPPRDATSVNCPVTDVEPPTELSRETVESFVDAFESDWIAASAPDNATRSGSVSIEAVRVADEGESESEDEDEDEDGVNRARVDASVNFSGRGWDGEITIRPFEDDESDADSDKDDTESADTSDPERVSTTADPIATSEPLLDAIDHVADTGEPRSITKADSLEALTEVGEYLDDFLIETEHDDKLLYAENDATAWESHGQWFVGYFLTADAVYRIEHDPGEWTDDNRSDEPLSVPDGGWRQLECWS